MLKKESASVTQGSEESGNLSVQRFVNDTLLGKPLKVTRLLCLKPDNWDHFITIYSRLHVLAEVTLKRFVLHYLKRVASYRFQMVCALTMDPVSFVRSLELENYSGAFIGNRHIAGSPKAEGFVDAGSLVSFTSQLNGQHKEDVLNSTLLAQLAANKKYDRYSQTEDWYKFYTDVMSNIGWVMQSFKFDEYKSTQQDFKISQVVLQLLSALIGSDKELMEVVKETLDGLAKSKEGVTLFSSNSTSRKYGNFQILPCTVDKGNQVNVGFIASHFRASQVDSNYFFFSYAKQDITLFKSGQVFTLNEGVYAHVREEVKKKLGKRAKDFVHNLDI